MQYVLGHLGDDFAVTALEAVLDEPLADEFLGELLLLFATLEALFVAVGIEVTGGVGRVDLVDEVDLTILLPEFVLRVDEDQATLTCHLLTTLEESVGVGLELLVVFFADQTRSDDFLTGDILVMADIFLRGGGDDGARGRLRSHACRRGAGYRRGYVRPPYKHAKPSQ